MPLDKRLKEGMLDDREAAQMMLTICRAMQYAHNNKILHRDIKPANILLTCDGSPKITDFGLAKKLEDADESSSTRTGTVMGTPSYMSPEQAKGLIHELGPATDQYSLGAMLYEFLTGRPPFIAAKPIETIMKVVRDEPVAPRQINEACPIDLETICLKALQKAPDKRYASCAEMADDLQRFLDGKPILARPVSRVEAFWRWCRRNPTVAVLTATAAALLIAVAGVSAYSAKSLASKNTLLIQTNADLEESKQKSSQCQRGIGSDERCAQGLQRRRGTSERKASVLCSKRLPGTEYPKCDGGLRGPSLFVMACCRRLYLSSTKLFQSYRKTRRRRPQKWPDCTSSLDPIAVRRWAQKQKRSC